MSAPRALIEKGTPSARDRCIAAGPSGQKNSASITSKGKRRADRAASAAAPRHRPCRLPLAESRQHAEARPMNRQPLPHLPRGQLGPRPVMRVQDSGQGGSPIGETTSTAHVRQRREPERLPLDEDAEGRLRRIREQGRQGQHAQHLRGA
jgi:hypothetical protein